MIWFYRVLYFRSASVPSEIHYTPIPTIAENPIYDINKLPPIKRDSPSAKNRIQSNVNIDNAELGTKRASNFSLPLLIARTAAHFLAGREAKYHRDQGLYIYDSVAAISLREQWNARRASIRSGIEQPRDRLCFESNALITFL
jgi:hypothetical protein